MASPLLDFKKFKHVKSDDKSTTLQHQDGHMLTVNHSALSKPNQAQLKALSKISDEHKTPSQKQESDPHYGKTKVTPDVDKTIGKVIMKAEGGEVPCPHCGSASAKMYAEPTEVVSQNDTAPTTSMPAVAPVDEANTVDAARLADTINQTPLNVSNEDILKAGFTPTESEDDKSLVGTGNKGVMPLTPEAPKAAPTRTPDEGIATKSTTIAKPQSGPTLDRAYHEGIAGAEQMAKATGDLGEAQALAHQNQADAQMLAISKYDEDKKALNQERLGHIQAIKDGQIDPEKYWTNHSKLMTGIGLILAGFNPTSNPNAATNFLKTQMEQNLTAQAKNLDSHQNLLAANLKQFGNLRDAADMTRVMQADYVSHKLGEAAAKAQTPMSKAAALTAKSGIDKEFQPLFMNLNMRQAAMNIANTPGQHNDAAIQQMISGLNSVGNPLGKTLGEAYIPGVGMSKTLQPVPEPVRKEVLAMKILDDKGKDVLNFIQQHKGVWNSEKDKNVLNQKVEEMKNFYNTSIGGGALTEGRLNWYDEQFSKHALNPVAQFLGSTAKLKEMVDSNGHRLNMTLDQQGITPLKTVGTQHQPEIKVINGVKYMRGPNGKAIPVK